MEMHTNCFLLLLLCSFLSAVAGKTVTYDFDVSWVKANPDGKTERKVVGINGQWPLPAIEIDKGDRLVVNVKNSLGDKNCSIHFHGMFQNGTNYMDGPAQVTQCPIPPGSSFVYNFTVTQNGTYWYHSHVDSQYPDGYRGAVIVRDKTAPFDYDEDLYVTLSDWYDSLIENINPDFLSLYNPTGAEPIPDAFLFNDTMKTSIPVKKNKTYLIRLINIGAFAAQYFYIEGHKFKIVEVDGVYVEPQEAEILYIAAAQRYAILLTAKDDDSKNFPIVTVVDSTLLDDIPSNLQLNQTNWLEYNKSAPHEEAVMKVDTSEEIEEFDDFLLVPYDKQPLLPEPDQEIEVTVEMNNLIDGKNYAFFNNITYNAPKVPALYTVMSSGKWADQPAIYGSNTNSFVLKHNQVVQLVLNNGDSGAHPFHLHGHTFQVINRSPAYDDDNPTSWDSKNHDPFPDYPMRRDTVVAKPNGNFVLRFVADNPGVWLFHCHIEWHLHQGLVLTLIEAPFELQKQKIPDSHYKICEACNVKHDGNAAGNSKNFFDLKGENRQPKSLPDGFTAKGVVALIFSIISAFIGMAAIVWYGLSDLSLSETKLIQRVEEDAGLIPEDIDPADVSDHDEH